MSLSKFTIAGIFLSAALFLSSGQAFAQIYQCGGKWQNRPCDGAALPLLEERPLDSRATDPAYKAKREIVRSFQDYAFRAREVDVRIGEVREIETLCLETASTVEECRMQRDQLQERYDKVIEEAHKRKEEERLIERVVKAEEAAKSAKEEAHGQLRLLIKRLLSRGEPDRYLIVPGGRERRW